MFAYGFPVTVDNKHVRAVVFFRKTPFSVKDQRELRQMSFFLEALGEKLLLIQAWDADRAFANLGRLSSAVMHELRNNIGLLKRPIKVLKSMINCPENTKDSLRTQIISLEQRYQTLENLLENNLNLIRKNRQGQFSLQETLERLMSFYQYEYESEKNTNLEIIGEIPKIRLDFPVLAFEQTIINLLQNALYYIPKNNGCVYISVQISRPDSNGHSIYIDITDNGVGIPASFIDKLFKPRESIKGKKGTGLGLYVSKNLLQAHGGDLVLAKNIRYFGTCFRIALPREFNDPL
jgi:signal transduction histidine kinase